MLFPKFLQVHSNLLLILLLQFIWQEANVDEVIPLWGDLCELMKDVFSDLVAESRRCHGSHEVLLVDALLPSI